MKNKFKKICIFVMWLLIWQIAATLIDNDILLAGPVEVGKTLGKLLVEKEFYGICLASVGRILEGFLLAFAGGILAGALSYAFPFIKEVLEPVLAVMKSIPVASFVVLLLIWQGAENLSVWISFFVVFPNACVSTRNGLEAVDPGLLEMAEVFGVRGIRRLIYIYKPALVRFLLSGMEISMGMAFKSGVAAEVIGIPDFSIGERIYMSKIYLDTAGLFAWTAVLIAWSFVAEKLVLKGMSLLLRPVGAYERGGFAEEKQVIESKDADVQKEEREEQKETDVQKEEGKEQKETDNETVKETSGVIRLSHIGKAFGEKVILRDINMEIEKGGRYFLMGPSGSGKTTLLRILAGLERPDEGEICPLSEVTYQFQEDRLLENEFTITNIMLTQSDKGNYRKAAGKAIQEGVEEILPKDSLFAPAHTLSGGMKRRCALARALFYKQNDKDAICLLDEPFTGLDEKTKIKCAAFIEKYINGRTLIVATHDEKDAGLLGGSIWRLTKQQE